MHEGCSGSFDNGLQMLQKIRMMGFNKQPMRVVQNFDCHECEVSIEMTTHEYECPNCGMIYAVTPCSSGDVNKIKPAGKNV